MEKALQCWDELLPSFSLLRAKMLKSLCNADFKNFVFWSKTCKCRQRLGSKMFVFWSKTCKCRRRLGSKRFAFWLWELLKSLFFKENVLVSVSLGSWKIHYFEQQIDYLFNWTPPGGDHRRPPNLGHANWGTPLDCKVEEARLIAKVLQICAESYSSLL